jgi:hypothetical protein
MCQVMYNFLMVAEAGADVLYWGRGVSGLTDIKRPGGPLPTHQLYEPRLIRDGKKMVRGWRPNP